jgi:N-acetylneuraminic acid mutarotase
VAPFHCWLAWPGEILRRVARTRLTGLLLGLALVWIGAPVRAQQVPEMGLPEVDGWSIAAPLLAPSSEQAVAQLGERIYLIGGYPPGRIPVDGVQIYDATTDRWQWGPSLPLAVHHAMAAGVNGTLYVIGGETGDAGTGQPDVYLDSVYALDPASGEWTPRAAMPTARSAGGVAVINDRIYVAGGRPPHGNDFAVYDPAADSWQVLPNLPTGRNHLAVAAIDGRLYVAGGRFGAGFDSEKTAALEIYDPASGAWSTGAPMPLPRGGVAGVEANGCLFVIGGEGNYADPRGVFPQNDAYDPRTDTWHSLAPMPTPTHGLVGAAFVDGLIHIPGGSVTMGGGTGSVIHQVYRPPLSCR